MTDLTLTARRVGDFESRTEEYELSFAAGEAEPEVLRIKYQAARAYEINAALDDAVETAREAIGKAHPDLAARPSDGTLSQFAWRAIQSVKYEEGESKNSTLAV